MEWDLFISHASEDKSDVARPLAHSLAANGLKVWFDESTLTVGDNLRRSVDHGLANCRFGVVVLSPHFFAKEWPKKELDGLVAREDGSAKRILPVWHGVSKEEVVRFSPALADKISVSTSAGLEHVVTEILRACGIEPKPHRPAAPDVTFIRSLSEEQFSEWVLIPLLEAMGYSEIRYTHGYLESGKDILFRSDDDLQGCRYFCATIALTPITTPKEISEILSEVELILTNPFIDPTTGVTKQVAKAFIVTPFEVSQVVLHNISAFQRTSEGRTTFIDGPRLMALITKYLPSLLDSLPNPESRYIYLLCQRFLDSPSLSRLGSSRPLTLADIYTGGTLSATTKEEAKYLSFAMPAAIDSEESTCFLADIVDTEHFCVVLADVGSGKTTLLQKLVLDVGAEAESLAGHWLPLFISLSSIPEEDLKTYDSFCHSIATILRWHDKLESFSFDTSSASTLLLDGFDELQGHHERVEEYIELLANRFARIIVTSRPSRTPNLSSPFAYYRLVPFGDKEIREFLSKWFHDDPRLETALFSHISEHPGLLHFCRTPLILTLYSLLVANSGSAQSLPVRRTALYEDITEMLLGKWDKLRNVRNAFIPDDKQNVLEIIALATQARGRRTFSHQALETVTTDVLNGRSCSPEPRQLINELVFRSSLIRRLPSGDYEFVHLSFQEFLAAKRLSRSAAEGRINSHLLDDWWKGTTIFYFGICRTMDGIPLPRRKHAVRGTGLRFMEFMADADFTGSRKRNEIIGFLANDLLHMGKLTQSDLRICHSIGEVLVEILSKVVSEPGFEGSTYNYFVMLTVLSTRRSMESLWSSTKYLERLAIDELLDICCRSLPLVSNDAGNKFVIAMLSLLRDVSAVVIWDYQPTLRCVCEQMVDVQRLVSEFATRKTSNPKVVARMLDLWRAIRVSFLRSIRDGEFIEQLTAAEWKMVVAAINPADNVRDVLRVVGICLTQLRKMGGRQRSGDSEWIVDELKAVSAMSSFTKKHSPEALPDLLRRIAIRLDAW